MADFFNDGVLLLTRAVPATGRLQAAVFGRVQRAQIFRQFYAVHRTLGIRAPAADDVGRIAVRFYRHRLRERVSWRRTDSYQT